MKLSALTVLLSLVSLSAALGASALESVTVFPTQQVTGVTVSKSGRVFVNFPFWSEDHTTSVAEVRPGPDAPGAVVMPYPNEAWNKKEGPVQSRWVCVQSVYVDADDALWVLDAASPMTEGIVPGGPKLVKIDLTKNEVVRTILFNEEVAPAKSYLNDVRMDDGFAYITESGLGAIIVVDLKTGQARRLLADHASTKVEPGQTIVVDGLKVIDPKTKEAPAFHADGIALDREGGWLYYHALTAQTLYRIKTKDLRDEKLSAKELGAKVEKMAETAKPDGMLEGRDGTLYLAAFEGNSIDRFDVATKSSVAVVKDILLQWPDTMAWGPDGYLYVTTSQIHRMPKYHGGQSKQQGPFGLYRVKLP